MAKPIAEVYASKGRDTAFGPNRHTVFGVVDEASYGFGLGTQARWLSACEGDDPDLADN